MLYYQCRFRRGAERTVAWIEARGATVGAHVELRTLDEGPAWQVESVNGAPLEQEALRDMQDKNRNAFASLKQKRKPRTSDE